MKGAQRKRCAVVSSCVGVAIAFVLGSIGTGCGGNDQSCIARGNQTAHDGTAAYVIAGDTVMPANGGFAAPLTTTDYELGCVYDRQEFIATIAGCPLWMRVEPVVTNDDDSSDSDAPPQPADVEAAQTCTLALPEGNATVALSGGQMTVDVASVDDDPAWTFSFDAALQAWNGAPANGTLHFYFHQR